VSNLSAQEIAREFKKIALELDPTAAIGSDDFNRIIPEWELRFMQDIIEHRTRGAA
jgi:hypothetical protein